MYELSVIIPGNNEEFMSRTVEDVLKNKRAKTEVIVVLDGGVWAKPPLVQHPDVNVIFVPNTIGQRMATRLGIQLSRARYVMKLDAHSAWDEGYDQKMLDAFKITGDNVVMCGIMKNLVAFNWKCGHCGFKVYQGPIPKQCGKCGKTDKIMKKIVWEPRKGTHSTSYAFDSQPHFQYFNEYTQRPEYLKAKAETGLTESMSLQGSCWMASRDKYWELKLTDPVFGSWGNEGLETACKMWLSGGKVLINHNTWHAHMFRTQADFSFPYDQPGNAVDMTKKKVWAHFFNGKFKQQIHPVSWLVEKFWPITPGKPDDKRQNQGWTQDALNKLKEKEKVV